MARSIPRCAPWHAAPTISHQSPTSCTPCSERVGSPLRSMSSPRATPTCTSTAACARRTASRNWPSTTCWTESIARSLRRTEPYVSSQNNTLFREEAIDFIRRQRGPGELVRVSTAWTERAYWALLVLVAAGLVASLVVRIGGDPLLYVLVPALKELFHG